MAKAKPKTKAEPKVQRTTPVTQLKIPARHAYGESPLEIAAEDAAAIKKMPVEPHLEGVIVGDFLVVCNNIGCDGTFIIHKDVLRELLEA